MTQPEPTETPMPFPSDQFWDYFGVADELSATDPGWTMTLDDLDDDYVESARQVADALGLPWPPDLAYAEEYALDLHAREARDRRAAAEELRVGGTDR